MAFSMDWGNQHSSGYCGCPDCCDDMVARQIALEREATERATDLVQWAVENDMWHRGGENGEGLLRSMQAAAARLGAMREYRPERLAPNRKSLSARKSLAVFARDDYACLHCGTKENLTVDHIHPVSKGGTNDMDNLQTLCSSCNSRKGDRT